MSQHLLNKYKNFRLLFSFRFASLLFFTAATAGFLHFMIRYSHGSTTRMWGIRTCYLLGFIGVAMLRISQGFFSESALLIVSTLLVSMVTFEISLRYLK